MASNYIYLPTAKAGYHGKFASKNAIFLSILLVIAVICLHPYGFLETEDSAVYFGNATNSVYPGFPFYYAGYAALIPEMTAYGAAYLPLWAQPPVYMTIAALIGVYFAYELLTFVRANVKVTAIALCIAATIILILIKTNSSFNFFTNLTYAIWVGWLGLYLRLFNGFRGVRAGPIEITVGILAALSHPFCVLLIGPILAFFLLHPRRDMRLTVECAAYLAVTCLYLVFFVERGFSPPIDLGLIMAKIKLLLTINRTVYVPVVLVVEILLGLLAVPAVIRLLRSLTAPATRRPVDLEIAIMGFVGLTTMIAYIVSPRFLEYQTVQPRYTIAAIMSLILALVVTVSSRPSLAARLSILAEPAPAARPGLLAEHGMMMVVLVYLLMLVAANSIKGRQTPELGFGAVVDGERFLLAAEDYRKTCTDGALIHHWNKWSPAVLCHRQALPAGVEPVPIAGDHISVWGKAGFASTAGRGTDEVPTLYQPLHDISLLHLH